MTGATPPPGGGQGVNGFTAICQNGIVGEPNRADWRVLDCQPIVALLFLGYRENGISAFYDAALAVYNYSVHNLGQADGGLRTIAINQMDTYLRAALR